MLQLDWPWIFLLVPLPLVVYRFAPQAKQEDAALLVPFYRNLIHLKHEHSRGSGSNYPLFIVLILIWILCLLAAARPQWAGDAITMPTSGRDLLVAVDISGSMQTADMLLEDQQVNRLTVVKKVVGEFLERRESDRVGLILFGTNAYLQAPLTFDKKTVRTFLDEAELRLAGPETAIGDAIGLSIKRLRQRPENARVLVLLTDGANTAGQVDPLKAAELAEQTNVKIYTIGIGANEWVLPSLFGGFGTRRVNPSIDLDENTLIAIAEKTGGQYFRAHNVEELEEIYEVLDVLEPLELEEQHFRPTVALFYYPLALAFLLSLTLATIKLWLSRDRRQNTFESQPT